MAENTTSWSPELYQIFGVAPEEFDPNAFERFLECIAEDSRSRVLEVMDDAIRTGRGFEIEYPIHRPDGRVVHILATGAVCKDQAGQAYKMVGTSQDVTARVLAETALRRMQFEGSTMARELAHRVKNTMATVIGLAKVTQISTKTRQDFVDVFSDRLVALSAVHDNLTRHHWSGAILAQMLVEIINAETDERVNISGPEVELSARVAVPLGQALFELKANADKCGALTTSEGRLTVAWQYDDRDGLRLLWTESLGVSVAAPQTLGMGLKLVQELVGREIGGTVEFEFAREGVRHALCFPIS